MKIVTPLTNENFYEPLISEGADEFYCGFVPYEWLKRYTNLSPLNRREFLGNVNICSFTSMKILGKMIDKYKIPVKITLNSLYYTNDQYPIITDIIKKLMDIGFKTFIIADLALIVYLRNNSIDCNIHLSGENGQINNLSIDLLNQFNISRYIFSRKDTLDDIKNCIEKNPIKNIEYETFILNELCPFSGAFCNTMHCDWLTQVCKINYKVRSIKKESEKLDKVVENAIRLQKSSAINNINLKRDSNTLGKSGCGLCKICELRNIGVSHLKVVGRGKCLEYLIENIRSTKEIIKIANNETDSNEFEKLIKCKYFNSNCTNFCYYPS